VPGGSGGILDDVAETRDNLRAADADREAAAERLKAALDEGRLTLMEYDERLRDAYAARTYGELNALFDDLPRTIPAQRAQMVPAGSAPDQVAMPASQRTATRSWLLAVWSVWLGAVLINVVIWLLVSIGSGDAAYFWPMWVAGPWGAFLLVSTVIGLADGEPHKRWGGDSERDRIRRARRARRAARRGHGH